MRELEAPRSDTPSRNQPTGGAEMTDQDTPLPDKAAKIPLEQVCWFPLAQAYLCNDCHMISNWSVQCPACASKAIMALSPVLGGEVAARESADESDAALRGDPEQVWAALAQWEAAPR
jgi:hypothetical protein